MNARAVGLAFCVALCVAAFVLMKSHSAHGQDSEIIAGSHFGPVSPAFEAQRRAITDRVDYLDDAAALALSTGRYAEAETDAREAVSVQGPSGRNQELLAQALDAQDKTPEALQAYQVIADAGANAPRNEWPYARLLLKTGQWAQAVEAYNTALHLGGDTDLLRQDSDFSPDVPQPKDLETAIHIGLGLTGDFRGNHWTRGPGDPTLSEFHKALALEPDSALANYYYGFSLKQLGHRAGAKAAFAKAAQLGGDDVKAAVERFSK